MFGNVPGTWRSAGCIANQTPAANSVTAPASGSQFVTQASGRPVADSSSARVGGLMGHSGSRSAASMSVIFWTSSRLPGMRRNPSDS